MTEIETFTRAVQSHGDRTFLIDVISDASYTFSEFQDLALRLTSVLREKGIQKGSRVGLLLQNSIEFALAYFACLYSGVIAVPINVAFHPRNINYIVETANLKTLVYSPETLNLAMPILMAKGRICGLCLIPERNRGMLSLPSPSLNTRDLLSTGIVPAKPFEGVSADDLFTITFTSGTTAKPKGIFHRTASYVASATAFNRALEVTEEDRFYHILPMAYMAGLLNLMVCPFIAGASIALCPSFDARLAIQYWKAAVKYQVNRFWMVPAMLVMLLKMDRDESGLQYSREKVKDAFVGTAPLPLKVKKEFEAKYRFPLWESYGLSETMFVTSNRPKYPVKANSVGKPLDGVSIRIEEGPENKVGEGEICIQTPAMLAGYLSETSSDLEDVDRKSWFRTGDIGCFDAEGNLYVTDRKKDLIIKAGVNISPRAVEETMCAHPAVEQVAVVGVPHDFYGEEVAAAVVLKRGEDLEYHLPSLKKLCEENLEAHSVPALIYQVSSLPAGPTGKILKRELRGELAARKDGRSRV